jgi:kinase
LYFFC